jgi:hypothetical protein
LWDYFNAGKILLAEIFANIESKVALITVKEAIYKLETRLLKADNGKVKARYEKGKVTLIFYFNGAVQVVIDDKECPKVCMEKAFHRFYKATNAYKLLTDNGCFSNRAVNTYTIPAGANMQTVYKVLTMAGFMNPTKVQAIQARP